MRYFSIFCVILLCGVFPVHAQQQLSFHSEKINLVNIDEAGNIYVVINSRTIQKYSTDLKLVQEFRAIKNGSITAIDVNNPMEILYFQPDFNRMTILDRLFAPKLEIDFQRLNHLQISAVGQSLDGHFWFYDVVNAQLIKMDKNYNEISRSNDLRLNQINDFHPTKISESAQGILAFEPGHGWVLFDRYSNIVQSDFGENQPLSIHFFDAGYMLVRTDVVEIYSKNNISTKLPVANSDAFIDALYFKEKIFFVYKDRIEIQDVITK